MTNNCNIMSSHMIKCIRHMTNDDMTRAFAYHVYNTRDSNHFK